MDEFLFVVFFFVRAVAFGKQYASKYTRIAELCCLQQSYIYNQVFFNFNGYGDYKCMLHFRFINSAVTKMMVAVRGPVEKTYCGSKEIAMCPVIDAGLLSLQLKTWWFLWWSDGSWGQAMGVQGY